MVKAPHCCVLVMANVTMAIHVVAVSFLGDFILAACALAP